MRYIDAGIRGYHLLPLIKIAPFQSKAPLILCCIRLVKISLFLMQFLFIKSNDESPLVGFLFFIWLVITPGFGDYQLISLKVILSINYYCCCLHVYEVGFGLRGTCSPLMDLSFFPFCIFNAAIRKGVAPDSWGWSI